VRQIRKSIILLTLALSLALVAAVPVQAKRPFEGSMDLNFYLENPIWRGTITGDISGNMYFTNVGTGKQGNQEPGKAIHFGEEWLITDESDVMLLTGTDEGVVSPNSEYRMNGVVTDASEEYADLIGRNVHMSGYITWAAPGLPETAPGTFWIH